MAHCLWDRRPSLLAAALLAPSLLVACNSGGPAGGPVIGPVADVATTLGEVVEVQLAIASDTPGTLTLNAESANDSVVPDAGMSFSGSGSSRTLSITPSSTTTGDTTVTVAAEDSSGQTTRKFTVTVGAPFGAAGELIEPGSGDPVGRSIAMTDDHLVVGGEDLAYVFERVGDAWVEMQKLTASDVGPEQGFGKAVAILGQRIVVGAPDHDEGADRAGAAYVFELQGSAWTQTAELLDPLPEAGDQLGTAVAIEGDYVFAGAPADVHAGMQSGSVFVFQFNDLGEWSLYGKLVPEDVSDADTVGYALDVDGDTLLVGNYGHARVGAEAGAIHVFDLVGTTWTEGPTLIPLDLEAGSQLGVAVAIQGEYALASSFNDDESGVASGAAYVLRNSSGWDVADKLLPPEPSLNQVFAASLALDYPYAVVGAPLEDSPLDDAGSVYVYRHDGATWHLVADLDSPTPAQLGEFGWDVATTGEHVAATGTAPLLAAVFDR